MTASTKVVRNIDVSYPNYQVYPDITTMYKKYFQHQSNKHFQQNSLINLCSYPVKQDLSFFQASYIFMYQHEVRR
jgi:hypothetical protein